MLATARSEAERYLFLRAQNQKALRDPLDWWRFGVPRIREAFRLFVSRETPIDELHLRGPNKSGKTLSCAAFVVSCLQKRSHLDGVPIPQWRGKVEGLQLVLDYPQQLLSVKPAYLQVLGGWPHKVRYKAEYLSSIHVMPVGGDPSSERDWSVIHFLSQKNMDTGRGARADIIHFDEPPKMFFLQELRKAGRAGRRCIRLIGETPERVREWAPLRLDYGDTPRRAIRRVDRYRAECRWSLDEVERWVLSESEMAAMRAAYATDPLKDAREHGDYSNAAGSSPWGEQGLRTLMQMLAECTPPEVQHFTVPHESEDGAPATIARVPVQVWRKPQVGRKSYQAIDPASGVDDGRHNPAGLLQAEDGSGDLQVRWNGYLAPFSLGGLGAAIARQYFDARVDIEMKDHWGVNVVRGFTASRYGNLCHENRELRPGEWAKEVGFDQNEETKSIIVGQIQEWLAAYAAGHKYAHCPSAEVIQALIDCELDERGKVVQEAGVTHGEDVILWGQILRRAVKRSNRPVPEMAKPVPSSEARLVAMIQGRPDPFTAPRSTPRYRPPPRVR